jgi:peptidoglycan/LPS O-acetylase OafA/YrhL
MVLVFHYTAHIEQVVPRLPAWLHGALTLTWSGVDLFFVLSGFLIGGILLDARASPNYFRVFYRRRVFRIFPLYFAFLVAFLIAAHFLRSRDDQHLFYPLIPWQACATFTQNFWMAINGDGGAYALTPTWSLAVEEQFYLTLPAVIYFVKPSRLKWFLIGGIVLAPIIRVAIFLVNPRLTMAMTYLLPCRMDPLLFGVGTAWLLRQRGAWEFVRSYRRHLWTAIELLTILCALFLFSPGSFDPPMMLVGFDCLGLLFASILVVTLADEGVARFLRAKWLVSLGTISYCVYVIHQLVFGITDLMLKGRTNSWEVTTILSLVVTIVIAKLSSQYFEMPLVRFGHREQYEPSRSLLGL